MPRDPGLNYNSAYQVPRIVLLWLHNLTLIDLCSALARSFTDSLATVDDLIHSSE